MSNLTNIKQDNSNSIAKSFGVDTLQKSTYELDQLKNAVKGKRLGKDIKLAVQKILDETKVQAERCYDKAMDLKEAIGEEPTKPYANYSYNKYKAAFSMPLRYAEPYRYVSEQPQIMSAVPEQKAPDDLYKKKNEYDELLYQYCDLMVDKVTLEKLIENIGEKSAYELSIDQLTFLNL